MSRYYNDPQEGLIPTSGYIIDTKNQTTTFTSSDVANTSDATSWTAVSKLNSGETHKSIFAKVSQMFKNVRFLYKMLGTTDISAVGDGTVTGGLSNLKSSLTKYTFAAGVAIPYDTDYVVPSDGYARIILNDNGTGKYATMDVNNIWRMLSISSPGSSVPDGTNTASALFVRKGMTLRVKGSDASHLTATFYALN